MIPLCRATEQRLDALFAGEERSRAARMLVAQCAETLPMTERATQDFWDRIRFAVLKLSDGDLRKLARAIQGAHHDWRDTLVAAGFGEDAEAHRRWVPKAVAQRDR